jgi:hypothetical protein
MENVHQHRDIDAAICKRDRPAIEERDRKVRNLPSENLECGDAEIVAALSESCGHEAVAGADVDDRACSCRDQRGQMRGDDASAPRVDSVE